MSTRRKRAVTKPPSRDGSLGNVSDDGYTYDTGVLTVAWSGDYFPEGARVQVWYREQSGPARVLDSFAASLGQGDITIGLPQQSAYWLHLVDAQGELWAKTTEHIIVT